MSGFETLIAEVRRCRLCEPSLRDGVRPVVQADPQARVLVAGQAPGRKVHASGIPFDDASGDRLRDWMGVARATFYDASKIAILPMGFCFPGTGKSGDLPPRPECAPAWRGQILQHLEGLELTLVIGRYAIDHHLSARSRSVTDTVKRWREHEPSIIPLPHPSPRNNLWLRRNPWFEQELIPVLRERVARALT